MSAAAMTEAPYLFGYPRGGQARAAARRYSRVRDVARGKYRCDGLEPSVPAFGTGDLAADETPDDTVGAANAVQ